MWAYGQGLCKTAKSRLSTVFRHTLFGFLATDGDEGLGQSAETTAGLDATFEAIPNGLSPFKDADNI